MIIKRNFQNSHGAFGMIHPSSHMSFYCRPPHPRHSGKHENIVMPQIGAVILDYNGHLLEMSANLALSVRMEPVPRMSSYLLWFRFSWYREKCIPSSRPLTCAHFCESGIGNCVLDLFNVLDLLEPSILRAGPCLRHKHPQFLEFKTLHEVYPCSLMRFSDSRPGIVNSRRDLFDAPNLLSPSAFL